MEEVGRLPFLDTSKSTGIVGPSSAFQRNIFVKYVLLRREGIERQHIESEENQPPAKDEEELVLRDFCYAAANASKTTFIFPALTLALAGFGRLLPLASVLPRYSLSQKGVWLFWASKEAVLWAGLPGKWRHCFYLCARAVSPLGVATDIRPDGPVKLNALNFACILLQTKFSDPAESFWFVPQLASVTLKQS